MVIIGRVAILARSCVKLLATQTKQFLLLLYIKKNLTDKPQDGFYCEAAKGNSIYSEVSLDCPENKTRHFCHLSAFVNLFVEVFVSRLLKHCEAMKPVRTQFVWLHWKQIHKLFFLTQQLFKAALLPQWSYMCYYDTSNRRCHQIKQC